MPHARASAAGPGTPERESSHSQAVEEYLSLFENAVCGIYRDRLDGTPVRANPALYTFNGYNSEEEHLAAVTRHGGSWYVDPDRPRYFQHLMDTQGFVRDLVSEVYRHRTRERAWITENAWYVRDKDGRPLFIEGTIQDATERVVAMAEIERHANTDALTGAASRLMFMKTLDDVVTHTSTRTALLTIDLDRFKEVNDLMGHSAGDIVLRTAAERLKTATRKYNATVARLGGDEFAVLLPELPPDLDIARIAACVVEAMRQPIDIEGHPMVIGASVGAALCPEHTLDAKELLTLADLALYEVKKSGKNDFCVFNAFMRAGHQRRKDLEAELNAAIASDALELFYQPILALKSRRIVGYEALMRWNHPRRGLLPPSEFIPMAEDAGLMVALGEWAIGRACRQAAALPDDVRVSVNISPTQLRSAGIVQSVKKALAETSLAPHRLVLEITETAILSSEAIASRVITELQGLGVTFALDDFGTGYSSLSYLQRYAFAEIKIDSSFVSGIGTKPVNLAIIRGIIGIARDIGIDVVAEGIETEAQAATLLAEGCGYVQGYLFSKPKPFADIIADLAVERLAGAHPVDERAAPRAPLSAKG
ncbi:putative bifunctional diguanylate cyclase/phosphodiesterase [Aestuariivirga sp.]|uniref:putative bifunctional diguanylate cyclase/phosphodiesterase n=1 Tax=Aestuariivirga sp. TaxID=2650926 RepID=UPI0039E3E4A7